MTDNEVQPAAQAAQAQQAESGWPRPGDEGYVTPDGTPQAAAQLEANRRAAADRAAAGSSVHGAPLATPGPQSADVTGAAMRRAEEYSGPTEAEREEGVTAFIRESSEKVADEARDAQAQQASTATSARQRTADEGTKAKQQRTA